MRTAKRPKTHKKSSSRHERINKKRYKSTSNRSWGWNEDFSGLFFDAINQAIFTNKSRRTERRGWKLVPKDSCEVYKDRKKRLAARKSDVLTSEEISNDTESHMEEDKKENKKKLRKKSTKKNIHGKKSKNKGKKRSKSYSVSACLSTSQPNCHTAKSPMDNNC